MRAQTPGTGASGALTVGDLLAGGTRRGRPRNDEAKKKAWLQFRQQAWGGFTGLPNRLIDGPAFAALEFTADVKVLIWFWQEARYDQSGKRKPGRENRIGLIENIINNGEISFTYQQAGWRGLSAYKFSKALKNLFRLGFIDIAHLGRGVKGEYTQFALSTRWKAYGTDSWREIPYPENFKEGFRSDKFKAKRRRRRKENNVSPLTLPALAHSRYKSDEPNYNVSPLTLENALLAIYQREPTNVSLDLIHASRGSKKRTRTLKLDPETKSPPFRRDENPFWAEGESLFHSFGEAVH